MLIGEALNRRSDLQKRMTQVEQRLQGCVLVQEGEAPPEHPADLIADLETLSVELERLIGRINHTNAASRLLSGATVTEAIAHRDVLGLRIGALRGAIRAATDRGVFGRYSRSEIRTIRQIKVADLQARVDGLAQELRALDDRLQEHNWTTPLLE